MFAVRLFYMARGKHKSKCKVLFGKSLCKSRRRGETKMDMGEVSCEVVDRLCAVKSVSFSRPLL